MPAPPIAAEDIIEKTLAGDRARRTVHRSGADAVEAAIEKFRAERTERETPDVGDIADQHRRALVDVDRRLSQLEAQARTADGNHEKLVAEHIEHGRRLKLCEEAVAWTAAPDGRGRTASGTAGR